MTMTVGSPGGGLSPASFCGLWDNWGRHQAGVMGVGYSELSQHKTCLCDVGTSCYGLSELSAFYIFVLFPRA